MVRRLSFGSGVRPTPEGKKKKKKKQKRKSQSPAVQTVRKAIGETLKLNMDELIQNQFFRDEERNFLVDEFRHRVTPLLNVLQADEELDTSMFTKEGLFKLAVSVAKKRSYYSPSSTPKNAKRVKRVSEMKKKVIAAAKAATAAILMRQEKLLPTTKALSMLQLLLQLQQPFPLLMSRVRSRVMMRTGGGCVSSSR